MLTSKLKYSIFQLIPMVLDSLKLLSKDVLDKDIMYSLLLVLSGILTDKNGKTLCMST
jgi:DNA repair/transcription protein MET18/MMS19